MAASELNFDSAGSGRGPLPPVPVFLYHGLFETACPARGREGKYRVSRQCFLSHLAHIHQRQARSILLMALADPESPGARERPAVGLTFDDGLGSDYTLAFPMLAAAGLRATFFVCTAMVEKAGYVSWAQLREMSRRGMAVESHGEAHAYLTRLSPAALRADLERSKAVIEDRLGQAVQFLAAPYGDLNAAVIRAAREAGYRAVCGGRSRPAVPGAAVIDRVAVYRATTSRVFRLLLDRAPLAYWPRAVRETLIRLPKRALLPIMARQSNAARQNSEYGDE